MAEAKGKREKQRKGPSLLEWIAAAVGALLVIGTLTFIGLEAIATGDSRPPILEVTPVSVVSEAGSHVLKVKVTNRSGQTAAAVEIEGELRQGGQTLETSNATLSYVPGHSDREAGLVFSRDPKLYRVKVRATGFELP